MLWELHHATGQPQQAERLVADLLAGDEWRVSVGHLLTGRGALMKGDLAAAERGYTTYLQRFASVEVAGELVAAASHLQGSAAGTALAGRFCAAASFPETRGNPTACAAALVAAGGDAAAATKLLAQQAVQTPDDLPTLRELAWKAQTAQQWEIAELTRRRIVALDPKASVEWVHLGIVLEKRGKTAELQQLLGETRTAFQRPPVDLLRAAGRAWTAAGDGRRAAPLLEEARAAMPPGSELGWIDAELREAYVAAGRWENPYAKPADATRMAALERAAAAGDLPAAHDYAVESMRDEQPREQCERGLAALERAATAGHKKSAAYLGRLLYYGSAPCRPAAPAAALGWLRRSVDAATRRPDGLFDLGFALVLGDAGESSPAEGLALIERAAAFPDLLAVEVAGLIHATGLGVPRDVAKARAYFAQADLLGSDSLGRLAQNARQWPQIAQLAGRAVERLQGLAGEGDAAASGLLARMHQLGHLVPHDDARALALARPAAAGGDPLAMRVLYYAHSTGDGVARDDDEGLRWLRRGAEAGDSYCMMFLSQRLMKGETVPRDVALAMRWLERAAETGNYWALHDVAHAHAEGWQGLPRDPAKAAPWMKRLAEQGDFGARGWLVLHGHSVQEIRELEE
jgi:TPR repeat protein